MADPFLKKQPSQLEKDTARKILENTLNKRTKPVKFTWEGLKNLSLFFDTNPFSKLKTDRLKDIMEGRSKAQEKDYIDFFEDVEARFVRSRRCVCPTGIPRLDEKDILQGGLGRGEIGVVTANTGVGKSHWLVAMGSNAMRNGKNVSTKLENVESYLQTCLKLLIA